MQLSRDADNMLETMLMGDDEKTVGSKSSVLQELITAGFVSIHEDGDYVARAVPTRKGRSYFQTGNV